MGRASQKFDRQLFTLKLSELSHQMQIESVASHRASGLNLSRIVDGQLAVLRKWLEGVDRICREVWQTQGETITPEFVREIQVPQAITTIETRVGVIKEGVDNIAGRTHQDPHAAWNGLAMKVGRLKAEVANRYEIEARELDYKNAPTTEVAGGLGQKRTGLEVAKNSAGIMGPKSKRGPKANMKFHHDVAGAVNSFGFGTQWKELSNLEQIAEKLDSLKINPPPKWAMRHPPARSWSRALGHYPDVVRKALDYALKMAAKDTTGKPSQTLANLR
jgi:hypothetical protein